MTAMTIQRINFVNRGQEFMWWEVQMDTGRIVGCGPHKADLWADGRCSVEVSTIQIGKRLTFHGPATEPGGRSLICEVASIRPADNGAAFEWGAR